MQLRQNFPVKRSFFYRIKRQQKPKNSKEILFTRPDSSRKLRPPITKQSR